MEQLAANIRKAMEMKTDAAIQQLFEDCFPEALKELEKGINDSPNNETSVQITVKVKLSHSYDGYGIVEPEFKFERKSGGSVKGQDSWFDPEQLELGFQDNGSDE